MSKGVNLFLYQERLFTILFYFIYYPEMSNITSYRIYSIFIIFHIIKYYIILIKTTPSKSINNKEKT